MKIALIGAPGSNKTKVAQALGRRLNREVKDWVVIDGYVEKLEKRTGQFFGVHCNLRTNFQVMAERWTLEDAAKLQGLNTITCGSIYESVIYSAAQTISIASQGDEELMLVAQELGQITGSIMGALEHLTYDYDALFYLPLEIPEEDTWNGVVDAKLPEVLDGFFKYAVPLKGTTKEKASCAEEIIRSIQKKTAATDERPGVPGSSAETSDQQPELSPVSDVPSASD